MTPAFRFLLLAALLVPATRSTSAQQIAPYFARVNAATSRNDAAAMAALFTPDGAYYTADHLNAQGRDALRAAFAETIAQRGVPQFGVEPGGEEIPAGEYVFVHGVYTVPGAGGEPQRIGYTGLMRRTPDGLIAHRLVDFPLDATPAEDIRPTVAQLVYETLETDGVAAAQARERALRAAAPAYVRFDEDYLNALGYQLLEQARAPEALAVFEMNAEAYPDAPNVYDSLGDGLSAAGRRADAVAAHTRAVALAESQHDPRLPTFRASLARASGE